MTPPLATRPRTVASAAMFKPCVLALVLAPLLLGGCASMSESECRVADWGRVGHNDGARGEPERQLAAYTEDCGQSGVVPDAAAYRQGWDVGIQRFCTPASGWQQGLQGRSSKGAVCAGQPGHEGFARALNAGLQVYQTRQRMQSNTQAINRLHKKLESATSDDEKRRIRQQLQDIDREQYRLRGLMGQQQLLAP